MTLKINKMKILGISCYYHDAAAALINNGKIIAAAEEERFSRIKHDSSFPKKAIDFCLEKANCSIDEINWVIFYEKPFKKFERILINILVTAPFARESSVNALKVCLKDKLWIKTIISKNLKVPSEKILFADHHLAHAAVTFYTSPFKEAAILTCDGVGEWTTTSWGYTKNNKIRLVEEIKYPHSLGLFYSAFTQYLGFQINEGEYKLMGLAPYGKPIYCDKVEKLIKQSADGAFKLDLSYFKFHKSEKLSFSQKFIDLFGLPPVNPKNSDKVINGYIDIAASAQTVLENKLIVIAKNIKSKTKMDNLCYSGGVALNGVANWKIFKEAGFKNIFIHPAAGDSGGSLGAALYLYHHVLGNKKNVPLKHVYFGKMNEEKEIKKFLEDNNIKASKLSNKELIEKIVNLLLKKKVVGWVRGRFEWGPRSLGSRSILADPRDKKMKDLVNAKIKFREAFRPFAPVCIYEEGNKYFDLGNLGKVQQPLQYMIAVVPVKKEYQKKLGAITHIDKTARPQLIKREVNPIYYDVIKRFGQKTGISVLLNTSFNLKGDPIINTCEDSYNTFMKSGIDALVFENYLIEYV